MQAAFTVRTNAADVLLGLRNGQKRRAYAIANGINSTAKKVQAAVRQGVRSRFTLRKPDFVLRQAAIIKPFASAPERRFLAVVSVGERARLLLAEFEEGGTRPTFRGRRAAVPVIGAAARPQFQASVPQPLLFKSLRLTRVRRLAPGPKGQHRAVDPQWRGASRTFEVKRSKRQPQGGVFQRVGPGKEDIRLLYAFVAGERVPRKLGFKDRARQVAEINLGPEIQRQVLETLRYHLGRKG